MDYNLLERDFPIFLKNIGKENQVQFSNSIISCDADKCIQYRDIWEMNDIPFEHGVMIYLITKMSPYNEEARNTISASDFVIKYYKKFKQFIPENNESITYYRDYKITNKWWERKLSIDHNGNEVLFDTIDELKHYVDDLYL